MSRPGLALIIHDGSYDRVHYALVMASGAAAINRDVSILFAGAATKLMTQDAPLPETDKHYQDKGIAGFDELLAACTDLGVTLHVCETALVAHDIDPASLRQYLPLKGGGYVGFLASLDDTTQQIFI
jgi:peroxiredoxin family protein